MNTLNTVPRVHPSFARSNRLSEGRDNPVKLERNPVSPVEREQVLSRIAELSKNESLEFWENWISV